MATNKDYRLVAEFMEYKLQNNPNERWFGEYFKPNYGWVKENELGFDNDWNVLMTVIDKIEGLGYGTSIVGGVKGFATAITRGDLFNTIMNGNTNSTSKIEATFKGVVEFVKWYNQKFS